MYRMARRVGFRIDPERAHALALRAVRLGRPLASMRARRHAARPVEAFGLVFRNPLGLAAGYDKDATAWRALAALGFGHVEVGTVTPRPQAGSPRPRLERIPERRAMVNRLGFPSAGVEAVARRIEGRRPGGVILGVSIGPNADTVPERRIDDYRLLVARLAPVADYLAINVSSPNTPGLRDLEDPAALASLLAGIADSRSVVAAANGGTVPVLVKLSPDLADLAGAAAAVEAYGADGIILGNTTTDRSGAMAGFGPGGLSGEPLSPKALAGLREVLAATSLPVVACGGVMDVDGVEERLAAGATLVQMYTGLVYRGPRLVHEVLDRRG
jgi:dihydroorotate dehydrogenase